MVAPKVSSAIALDGFTIDVTFDQVMDQAGIFYTPASYVLTGGLVVSSVSSPLTTVARLTLTSEMTEGSGLTVTVDSALKNVLAETMDLGFLSAAFTGVGDLPTVSAVAATAFNKIRVTFDEPMTDDVDLRAISAYVITAPIGAVIVSIASIAPEAVANPNYVDLTLTGEMTNGALYELKVDVNQGSGDAPKDVALNEVDPLDPANTKTFTGLGVLPTVLNAQVLSGGSKVRINFSEPMRRDGALQSIGNYVFIPVTAGAKPLFFGEVDVPDQPTNPTFVEIETSEMTDGATYRITVDGPTDIALNPMDGGANFDDFIGVGSDPFVDSVVAIGPNRVDVIFNETMLANAEIVDSTRYTWDNGLLTLSVLEVSGNTVKLVTSDQTPELLYTLTVDPI